MLVFVSTIETYYNFRMKRIGEFAVLKPKLHYFDLLYNKSTTNRYNGVWFKMNNGKF